MALNQAIDITSEQRETLISLLSRHLPNTEVRVYGSRVRGASRPASDLDMVVFATPEQAQSVSELRESFEESNLSFRVDLFVWDDLPDSFRKQIEREHVVFTGVPTCTEGFRTVQLGECIVINDATYSPKEAWPFVNYLDTGSITENRIEQFQHLTLGQDKLPSRARRKAKPGDIVYSTVRPNQKHFGLLRDIPENLLVSTGFAVFRGREGISDTSFIYWLLTQDHVVKQLHTIAEHSASAYPSIRPADIEQFEITLPHLPEQRAIARILGSLDDKIALNRRMNETLEALARAIFKDWFVDFGPTRAKMKRGAPYLAPELRLPVSPRPPEEDIPIPDFRTFAGHAITRPSPNLLDTIYACQERQGRYRDFARVSGEPDLDFVGSASVEASPETVAARMRETLGFDLAARGECPTWADALRLFVRQADDAGVLVMVSGVVMSNNRRRLDPAEFRGFALCDPLAPLIFINGKDPKAAQMFTLAHELAHIWLGATALSNLGAAPGRGFRNEEVWCNAVVAEFLVPLDDLRSNLRRNEPLPDALSRLARTFKVSTLVILRRLLDEGWLTRDRFDTAWAQEHEHLRKFAQVGSPGGGDFHRTTVAGGGRRFARALVVSTLDGHTLYRDAFRMLGVRKTETFNNLGREAGVMG